MEALAPILLANPRGVLLARDELNAWLCSFDRYSAKGGADVGNWLSMHVGESIVVDRKSADRKTIYVPHAHVCVTGGIQPGTLRRVMTEAYREAGLLARLLLAYPPRRPKRWTEAGIDPATEAEFGRLVEELYNLQPTADENAEFRPVVLRLSPEAKAVWIEFYNINAEELAKLDGDLASASSKLEEYAARLALVIHCVRVVAKDPTLANPDVVDEASMTAGVTLANWFKREAERVYGMLAETPEDTRRRKLVEWVAAQGGEVTVRDLTHGLWQYRGNRDKAEEALNDLVKAGLGKWEHRKADQKGGDQNACFDFITTITTSPKLHEKAVLRGFGDGDVGDAPKTSLTACQPPMITAPISGSRIEEVNQAFMETEAEDFSYWEEGTL